MTTNAFSPQPLVLQEGASITPLEANKYASILSASTCGTILSTVPEGADLLSKLNQYNVNDANNRRASGYVDRVSIEYFDQPIFKIQHALSSAETLTSKKMSSIASPALMTLLRELSAVGDSVPDFHDMAQAIRTLNISDLSESQRSTLSSADLHLLSAQDQREGLAANYERMGVLADAQAEMKDVRRSFNRHTSSVARG